MEKILFEPVASPYLVPYDGSFKLARGSTAPPESAPPKKDNEAALASLIEELQDLQIKLYAHNKYALLLVFQAMDAAGKDGTIKAVMSGVNPAGCQVYSFKAPTPEELDHDFLWRCWKNLPERGRIGIFNRSYYEEVLVVKVNPSFLDAQHLPRAIKPGQSFWQERYQSIIEAERHWARNGVVILKFFLNVSKAEQKKRLLARIDDPRGYWKFSIDDIKVRRDWDAYMKAYDDALRETSRPWAPWYAIPADSKSHMRRSVAEILVATLKRLDINYPAVSEAERAQMLTVRAELLAE